MYSKYSLRSCCRDAILSRTSSMAANAILMLVGGRYTQNRRVHTHGGILVGDRSVRSHSLVLAVNKDPQTDVLGRVTKLLGDLRTELDKRLGLGHAVAGEFSRGNSAVVERREIKALVLRERLVRDDLRDSDQ